MSTYYDVMAGVSLDAAATAFVSKVASGFHSATGKRLMVTSAYRGPQEQAAAMYVKMNGPEWGIYANKTALKEIRAAYLRGKAARQDRSAIVASWPP